MKALARGSIVRLASLREDPGRVFSRDGWSAGRCLAEEEQQCGMVARMADLAPLRQGASPALNAVVKARTADFQVNEIDASGEVAFLERTPKGRWRKISRAKTLLVENTATPFSDPDKTYAPRVQSHGEYVRHVGRLPKGKPVLRFVMYRDGYSLPNVYERLRYEINVKHDAATMHQTPGGFFGCISQFGSGIGVTKEQLPHAGRHYNLHPLLYDPRAYHEMESLPSLTAPPSGYAYKILLRCVDGDEAAIAARLRALAEDGFINYFGMERFGISSNRLFDMAALSGRGELLPAVGCYLQSLAESDGFLYDGFMAYANAEESTTSAAAAEWACLCRDAKSPRVVVELADALHRYHASGGAEDALQALWAAVPRRDEGRRSAAEFVWNAMASQRMMTYGGRVVKGDLVRQADSGGGGAVRVVQTDAEADALAVTDVVLPVPYEGSAAGASALFPEHAVSRRLFGEFAQRHSLSFLFSGGAAGAAAEPTTVYRSVVVKPAHMEAAVVADPSSLAALKSDLFLLQERKGVWSRGLDYENRVREPSIYNVSERFVERAAVLRERNPGRNSVALSFALPSDSSPLVALREPFALKYAHFHDLFAV